MTRCMCLVQAGQTPDTRQAELETVLIQFAEQAFDKPAEINWISIAEGNGFTAAAPSTSSIVSMTANQPLTQDRRHALLSDLCDRWMDVTGCSLNEIVAVISDPQ